MTRPSWPDWRPAHRPALAPTVVVLILLLGACGPAGPTPTPGAATGPTAGAPTPTPTPEPEATPGPATAVFVNANVLTMDDAMPRAEAIAIEDDRILAVGSSDELAPLVGPDTVVVDLAGATVVPGLIDAHTHRIGDGPSRLGRSVEDLLAEAVAVGWTTIDELYVDEGRLAELQALDAADSLRVRVNAYLPVQANSATGELFGDWYAAYQPGQQVAPRVRVAGLKVFTDFDNATILLWPQSDLDEFLLARHQEGWQLAVKSVATESLAMILEAFEGIAAVDPDVAAARGRVEHMLFATRDQVATVAALGLVPVVNLNLPGPVDDPGFDALIDQQPDGSQFPWRSLFEAGIPAAGLSGFPSLYAEEPAGAPNGSPLRLMSMAVTRTGNLGLPAPRPFRDQALTAEQALRSLTIHAAYASFEDGEKGSIVAGKLADFVILSADPLAVAPNELAGIEVLATLIGGQVEHCDDRWGLLCP